MTGICRNPRNTPCAKAAERLPPPENAMMKTISPCGCWSIGNSA